MPENIERLTFMESKILELGKKQFEKGYQGGAFTPGFIRKETEYGYRAINIALEALIARGLIEKSVTSTFRNGSMVELDVYKITDKGLLIVEEVNAGNVQIHGKVPPAQPMEKRPAPEPRSYSKPWESSQSGKRPEPHQGNTELSHTMKGLESTMQMMADDLKALHAKLDRLMEGRAPEHAKPHAAAAPAEPKTRKRKPRVLTKEALFHRRLVLEAAVSAGKLHDVVLAEDVKKSYLEACKKAGVPPKGEAQFTTFLKRMQAEGLVALKRSGCKALGIKGQGTRVVVALTPEGEKALSGRR